MVKTVRISNEAALKKSLTGDHDVTVIEADYTPAIFRGYNINYCFEDKASPYKSSAPNFRCLKHVFHPFNFSDSLNDINFPYKGLCHKIINGHKLHIELSIKNTQQLRLCQGLLGFVYCQSTTSRRYSAYRDRVGTVPVPFIIGQCDLDETIVPAWGYFWWVSDYNFWAGIEDILENKISQFGNSQISDKFAENIWNAFKTFASDIFSANKDIERKRVEGPDYLNPLKWKTALKSFKTILTQSIGKKTNKPVNVHAAVRTVFRDAFYNANCKACCDPFAKAHINYLQLHDYEKTDLAIPQITDQPVLDCLAVAQRFGLTVETAKKWNADSEREDARRIYTEFQPPLAENYVKDSFGNIIAFKQQLGEGMIIAYPEGREGCIIKPSGKPDKVEGPQVLPDIETAVTADAENIKEVAKSPASVTIDSLGVTGNLVKLTTKISGKDFSRSIGGNKILMFIIMYYYSVTGKGIGYLSKRGRAKAQAQELVGYDKDNTAIPISPKIYPINVSTEYSQHFRRLVTEILTGRTEIKEGDTLLKSIWDPSADRKKDYNTGCLSSIKINITAEVFAQLKQTLPKDLLDEEQTQLDSLFSEMAKTLLMDNDGGNHSAETEKPAE